MKNLVRQISENYDVGDIVNCELIHDGIDNQIYKLISEYPGKQFVVRISKRNDEYKNLDFEIELLRYLTDSNFNTPKLIPTMTGENSIKIKGAHAVLFNYVDGDVFYTVDEDLFHKGYVGMGGRLLGELHLIISSFKTTHTPKRTLFTEIERLEHCSEESLQQFDGYRDVLSHVKTFKAEAKHRISAGLPGGIIHNDYHIGNIIYTKDGSGVYALDFDWACNGPFIKDVGLAIGAWACGDIGKEQPEKKRIDAFLAGYNTVAVTKINYDRDLLFWICFAFISETCTFFPDVIGGCYKDVQITNVNQCRSYMKFLYFLSEYLQSKA